MYLGVLDRVIRSAAEHLVPPTSERLEQDGRWVNKAHYLAIISFSLLEECPPLPRTLAGVDRK